jgi:plastocyanin domain-containing protein
MMQEIIVYIIGIGAVGYILWRIFRKKKKDPCEGCTACAKEEKCAKQ